MKKLIKNNAGYDLKQLFIGTEGTLGIVTRVVLRLRSKFFSRNTALLAVDDFVKLPQLLKIADSGLGGSMTAFETMWDSFYQLVMTKNTKHKNNIEDQYPYYVLIESKGSDHQTDTDRFQSVLEDMFNNGLVADAILAESHAQREALWEIRDDIETLMHTLHPAIVFDISLHISDMEDYLQETELALKAKWPDMQMVVFGHLGDNNLHLALSIGTADEDARHQVEEIVYQNLQKISGSISAEHGIGIEKRSFLKYSCSDEEIALMKTMKQMLDKNGILNPGKVF